MEPFPEPGRLDDMRDEHAYEGRGDAKDREILALLKDLPVPPAAAGFYDRALGRAVLEGRRRQRRRWRSAARWNALTTLPRRMGRLWRSL